jgi:ADP-ribose pyrophosphatase YjhB (NUDIX family)
MPREKLIVENMVINPALRLDLVARILAADLPNLPRQPWHAITQVHLADDGQRGLFVRHAADAVLMDEARNVVLITRRNPPGAGRLAIPGGFLDVAREGCEDVATAARRELHEETGITESLIAGAALLGIGSRRYDRPFDLRVAWHDFPGTEVRQGDIFMVSTQPVYFRADADLTKLALNAGDDAAAACVMNIAAITADTLGIPDQYTMLLEAP